MNLAYCYPWYLDGDCYHHVTQEVPLLVHYGTDSPTVADQHILWELRVWEMEGCYRAAMETKCDFCMLYESISPEGTGFQDGTAQVRLVQDLQTMKGEHFTHPSYFG